MNNDFNWYTEVDNSCKLNQGDFLFDFPILVSDYSNIKKLSDIDEVESYYDYFNVIVLTQSCDLEQDKTDSVLLCPIWNINDLYAEMSKSTNNDIYTKSKIKAFLSDLKSGRAFNYHLLNICNELSIKEYLVLDFRQVYTVSYDYVKLFIQDKKRIRLLHPYREHLSQRFANFFMRVGLPIDIDKDIFSNALKPTNP